MRDPITSEQGRFGVISEKKKRRYPKIIKDSNFTIN